MRKWCAVASRLVSERAASFATCCLLFCRLTLVDWCTRNHRRRGCDGRPTTSSLAMQAGNKHTQSTDRLRGRHAALTRGLAFLTAFVSAAMTKWCVAASQLVSEQEASFAVCYSTVWRISLVEWYICHLRRRGCRGRPTKSGKASQVDNKHTHWIRRMPDRYTILTWGIALVSAFVSANTNRINPVFVVHLFSCVFACQALRALAKGRRPTGWIKKARAAGRTRLKARRRQTQPLCRMQVLLAVLVVSSPGTILCVHTVGHNNISRANHMWCVARKLRNQLMRALHGNTMHPAKRMATEKKGVDKATCSSTYPTTKSESSNPTPLKKQKSEAEANVTQYALLTSAYSPVHNQSAEEVVDLDQLAQARIGCDITKVPGDGWCFFHAVSRHCSNWNTWSITHAAELYLQALEWLCNQKYGPKAEDVQLACVPFDDRELELHKQYLLRAHKSNPSLAELTDSEMVLLSKLVAVLQKPRALDSIHHGSFVELWALAETFDFHCLIWSQDVDHNLWVRDQAIVSDQEAHARLQEHPQVLELLHRQIGVTGHYDIVDRSASLRPPFPDTTWTLEWKRAGADAVLQRAADTLETPLPPLPPPCEPPQSSPQEHRSRRGSTAELDSIDRPTTDGVCQGSSRPARRRRTGVRIAQHLQPSCAEHSSCKRETFVRCDGAIEQEDNVAPHPATAAAATDAQQITDTRSTMQRGADDVWPQSTAVEESEGTATDVDLDSVLSWDSETSERSNDADLEAVVEPHKSWLTIEDRAIDGAKHLATHFRLHPLLPCVLSDKDLQTLGSNSGLVYPAVHCAFDGCQWASDAQPCHPHWSKEKVWRIEGTTWSYSARACCGNAATCLWAHLKENHHTVFEEAAHRAAGGSAELAIPSQYVNALLQKEDQQVPQVGWSVDRRTLRRLQKELQETSCEALICACCAGIHAGGDAGDIAYLSAAELFGSLSLESFTCNWNLDTYMKQYATSACVRDRFDAHEWSRLLPASLYNGQKIVCCPEDLRCTACDVGNGQLCETCELPICHQCLVQMFDKHVLAVPQALANDNWYGYPTELLYKHKVRWIEAAAASPLWTSVVTYYVEADRGHLVEETLHRAEHRTAVRGNVSSFSLPWEEVLAAFAPEANTRMPWTKLPHKRKVMQAMVKITVKGMLHNEAIEWVAGARIRPWVVVALLQHLIDLQHPMCDNHISPEKAKEEVKQRVTQRYGTEETMPLGEAIPEDVPVAAPLSSAQESPKARPTQSSRSRPAAPKQSPPASARHSGQASKPVAAARPDAKLSKVAVDTASGDLARTTVSTTPTKLSVVASDNAQSIARGASIVVAADDTPCIAVVEVEGSEKTNSQTRTTTVEKYVQPVVSVAAVGPAKTLSASMHSPTSRAAPPQKHATPETAASAAALDGQAFTGVHRPNVLSQDYATSDWREPDLERLQELAHAADQVTVETGHTFWDQWQNDFLPWAFPFSLPAPVSGPDFPHKTRPRRPVHAPNLNPLAHLKLLAGRVESSIRNSWDFVPGLRRLTFKWQSVCNGILWRKRPSQRDCVQATPTASWVEAAKGLYSKLRSGTYLTASGQYKPIHFDTRKLPYAKGLTSEEHHLLQDVRSMQRNMPGTIESRRRIGRFLFGARVELGEPLFITISPTSRHNALYIKFSRYRQADPGSTVFGKRTCPEIWESANATMFVPPYDTRRQLTARDPWAVVLSFQTIVRCIFAKLLGIRMCFRCPACDCRDASGNGCHVTGGLFGLVRGLCGAIEYQTNSTPHFHCNVYSASIWQQPLHELAEKLNNRTIEFDDVKHFLTWIHPETHPDFNVHNAQQEELEAAWNDHNSHEKHDFLCHWPNFIQTDDAKSPWLDDMVATRAVQEAQTFIETYRRVAQSRMSHQQIHWHPYSIVQKCRLPISACRKKNAPNKCKHSFPKVQNDRGRVICRGNARKFGLSTAGRRNALGTILDKREDPWLSGTMYAFTLMLFGNSHTAVNFRVPLTAASHDAECARGCLAHNLLRKLQRAMAQAARRSTRYFTGYLQKPQPLGRKELQHAAKQLHFLETAAADDPAAQQRKVAHRVLGDLEFRCSTRPMTEEFMLAGFATSTEPTSAECIRSFPVVPFVGTEWLSILDNCTETRQRVKPSNPHSSTIKFSEVYGWRGTDPRVWFLSPWEFVKWWTVKKLQPPHGENAESDTGLSVWVNGAGQTKKPADGWKFGRDFVWKDSLPAARVTPFFACRKYLSVKLHKTTILNDAANLASHTPQSVHCRNPICHEKPKLSCLMFTFDRGP